MLLCAVALTSDWTLRPQAPKGNPLRGLMFFLVLFLTFTMFAPAHVIRKAQSPDRVRLARAVPAIHSRRRTGSAVPDSFRQFPTISDT